MPDENEVKPIEVAVPEVKQGTVEVLSKAAFNNPAPAKMKRILAALRYLCVGMITAVGGSDLFSGRQAKIIVFILGLFILTTGAIEIATGVKPADEKE